MRRLQCPEDLGARLGYVPTTLFQLKLDALPCTSKKAVTQIETMCKKADARCKASPLQGDASKLAARSDGGGSHTDTPSPKRTRKSRPCHPERSRTAKQCEAKPSRISGANIILSPRRSRCYASPYGFDCGRRMRLPPLRMTRGRYITFREIEKSTYGNHLP